MSNHDMKLFDDIPRSDASYKHERETSFDFLNRCALPKFGRVRAFLEEEVSRFPLEGRGDLITRIRKGGEVNTEAAIFELLLYGGLARRGYGLQPHPSLPSGSPAHPDFLVTSPGGDQFYLEATLATETFGGQDGGAQKRKNVVLDDLNEDVHPDFFLMTSSSGDPRTQPSSRKLRHEVRAWLATLNYEDVAAAVAAMGYDAAPTLQWQHENWTLVLRAMPVPAEKRGKWNDLVGGRSGGGGWVNRKGPLRNALDKKSNHYGELELPLIVAVNLTSGFHNRMDEVATLYGDETQLKSKTSMVASSRRPFNGFFHSRGQPRRQELSAAWMFHSLNLYNTHAACDIIYPHPGALRPMPEALLTFSHARLKGDVIEWAEGERFASAYGIDPFVT